MRNANVKLIRKFVRLKTGKDNATRYQAVTYHKVWVNSLGRYADVVDPIKLMPGSERALVKMAKRAATPADLAYMRKVVAHLEKVDEV